MPSTRPPAGTPSPALAQALAGAAHEQSRATPAAAFALARATFRRGERLDMAALAAELGVARTTLYRWTGDREQLLSDLIWADMHDLLVHINEHATTHGEARIREVAEHYLTALNSGSMQRFLAAEGDTGLRLITNLDGAVRPRLVATVAALIAAEAAASNYRPPEEPALLADVIVSVGERFLHHNGDPAMNPDLETARRAIGLIVRENAPAS
jgi:AcrR family transcriptional regulator